MNLIGLPEYCVESLKDGDTVSAADLIISLEKAEIKYIKNFLELEGNTATEKDILLLTSRSFKSLEFDGRLTPKDIDDIYGMKKAYGYLLQNYKSPVSEDHLFAYNSFVVTGDKEVYSGRLRHTNVWITGTNYVPPQFTLLPRLFENMFKAVDCLEGAQNKAVSYLLAISKNQFFIDGNKRTARLAALHELAYGKQKLLSPQLDTAEYMKALLYFYETGDTKPFAQFFMDNLFIL